MDGWKDISKIVSDTGRMRQKLNERESQHTSIRSFLVTWENCGMAWLYNRLNSMTMSPFPPAKNIDGRGRKKSRNSAGAWGNLSTSVKVKRREVFLVPYYWRSVMWKQFFNTFEEYGKISSNKETNSISKAINKNNSISKYKMKTNDLKVAVIVTPEAAGSKHSV